MNIFKVDKYGEYQLDVKDLDKAIDWYLAQRENDGLRKNVYWISIRSLVEQDSTITMRDHFAVYYIDKDHFKSRGQQQVWNEMLDFISECFPDYRFEVRYFAGEPSQIIRTDKYDMWAYGTILRYVDVSHEIDARAKNWEHREASKG